MVESLESEVGFGCYECGVIHQFLPATTTAMMRRPVHNTSRRGRDVESSVLLSMVNRGHCLESALEEFLQPANEGLAEFQAQYEVSERRARRDLKRRWRSAEQYAQKSPAGLNSHQVLTFLETVREELHVRTDLFGGRAGLSNRNFVECVLYWAHQVKSTTVRVSVRQAAAFMQCTPLTASRAARRVASAGLFVELIASGNALEPATYRVTGHAPARGTDTEVLAPVKGITVSPLRESQRLHQAFTPAGLGPSAARVYAALPARAWPNRPTLSRSGNGGEPPRGERRPGERLQRSPKASGHDSRPTACKRANDADSGEPLPSHTVQELSSITGLHPSTVRRQLKRLVLYALAERSNRNAYTRGPALLHDVALVLGVERTDECRTARYERERVAHMMRLVSLRKVTVTQDDSGAMIAVDRKTGRVLGGLPDVPVRQDALGDPV